MNLEIYSNEELYILLCSLTDIVKRKEKELRAVNELISTIQAEINRNNKEI